MRGISSSLHKELSVDAIERILNKKSENGDIACAFPIYAATLMELLCSFEYDDYQKITEQGKVADIGVAEAINLYICQTINQLTGSLDDVLFRLIEKSRSQLGRKFDYISALVSCFDEGISEQDLLMAINKTDIKITSADFSLYRRMFRIHMQQKEAGRWSFTHSVVRNAIKNYIDQVDLRLLWRESAEYFYKNSAYSEAIICYKMCDDLGKIVEIMRLAELLFEKILGAVSKNFQAFLRCCSLEDLRFFATTLKSQIDDLAKKDVEWLSNVCINTLKYYLTTVPVTTRDLGVIADLYYSSAYMLLKNSKKDSVSFFEISMNLYRKYYKKDPIICYKIATDISILFEDAGDTYEAQNYAEKAVGFAKQIQGSYTDKMLYKINALLQLGKTVGANHFSLKNIIAHGTLFKAMLLAKQVGNNELAGLCAVEYLNNVINIPIFYSRIKTAKKFIKEVLEKKTNYDLYVRAMLCSKYTSDIVQKENEIMEYATVNLARQTTTETVRLYYDACESLAYSLMSEKMNQTEITKKVVCDTELACEKLERMTCCVVWADKKQEVLNDLAAYLGEKNAPYITYTENVGTSRKLKSSSSRSVVNVLFIIGIIVCICVLIITLMHLKSSVNIASEIWFVILDLATPTKVASVYKYTESSF